MFPFTGPQPAGCSLSFSPEVPGRLQVHGHTPWRRSPAQFQSNSRVPNRPRGHRRAPERGDKAKIAAKQVPKKFPVFSPPSKTRSPDTTQVAVSGTQESPTGEVLRSVFARAGVLFPRPSGHAERQTTHSSTPRSDECKRAAHESARDSPSLECRGRHTIEHPDCVVWFAAKIQAETAAQSSLVPPGRVRRASARESPCPTPMVGRQRVTSGSGVMVSLRDGDRQREASRRATQHDLTEFRVTNKQSQTRAPQESVPM